MHFHKFQSCYTFVNSDDKDLTLFSKISEKNEFDNLKKKDVKFRYSSAYSTFGIRRSPNLISFSRKIASKPIASLIFPLIGKESLLNKKLVFGTGRLV